MNTYTIGNAEGKEIQVRLAGHTQHIWHTSEITVSARIAARIRRELGDATYTNPSRNFGRAHRIVVAL